MHEHACWAPGACWPAGGPSRQCWASSCLLDTVGCCCASGGGTGRCHVPQPAFLPAWGRQAVAERCLLLMSAALYESCCRSSCSCVCCCVWEMGLPSMSATGHAICYSLWMYCGCQGAYFCL